MAGKEANAASDRYRLRSEPEAERTVIGSLLLAATRGDGECSGTVFNAIKARDFADAECRTIFAAMERLRERGKPLEHGLLVAELKPTMENPAGVLLEAAQSVATTASVGHYATLVANASRQRRAVCVVNDTLNDLRNCDGAVSEVIAELRAELADIERSGNHGAELIRAADVEPESVEWLWLNRIAIGKVTLLAGDPGLGKSIVTLGIAAAISRGASWPDAPHHPQPVGGVVLLSAEDDLADTIRPRLDALDADCQRVFVLASLSDLGRDIDQLRVAIDRVENCRLIIVDPISAYMGDADSHKNAEVRAVLAPLADLAAEKRVAIVGVTHLRKGEGPAMYRAMGSLAFIAAARAAWCVVRDKKQPRRRLMLAVKNNLAADSANGLAFTIEPHGVGGAPVVCWEHDPVIITADEALAPEVKERGRPADDREDAEQWLREALGEGPRPAKEVADEGVAAQCISKRTLDRARKAIGVVAFRPENPGPWWWRLPDDAECLNGELGTLSEELWHSGNLPDSSTDFDDFGEQDATLPEFQDSESDASTNGWKEATR